MSVDSFFTDCPLNVTTESLPPGLDCYIPSPCTAVYCCLNATTPFQQALSAFLDLDPCNQRLLIGIEKYVHTLSLFDIVFGKMIFHFSIFISAIGSKLSKYIWYNILDIVKDIGNTVELNLVLMKMCVLIGKTEWLFIYYFKIHSYDV